MAERDSAAKRRRDRRLRMHWRHEQLTLRMALAAALHHSRDVGPVTYNALRSQKTARAREEEENEMHFATGHMTPPPRAAAAEYYPLTPGAEAGGVLAAGGRPSPLVEVGRRSGICGAPWCSLSTLSLSCRFSTTLCRRWWNSC